MMIGCSLSGKYYPLPTTTTTSYYYYYYYYYYYHYYYYYCDDDNDGDMKCHPSPTSSHSRGVRGLRMEILS